MKNFVAFLGCGVLALAIGCGDGGSAPVAPTAEMVKPGQPQMMMTTPPADAGVEKKEEPAAETKEEAPAEKKEVEAPAEKKEEAGEKKE